MKRFNVTLSGPPMNLGGLGTAATGYTVRVEATDARDAVEKARERIREERSFREYADGHVQSCLEVFEWLITLRGTDKRKRETFIVTGTDEVMALRALANGPSGSAVWRFAKFGGPKIRSKRKNGESYYVSAEEDPRVVRIERREWR